MTTSHPSAVWDGKSSTRPDGNVSRGLDGHDWQRLVSEIISVSDQLDALGVDAAGAFATSDPDKGKRVYANTLVLTLGGNSAAEDYPNRWDKTTPSRPSGDDLRAPDYDDWLELVTQINNLEKRVQPLGIPAGGVLPTSEPATGGYLWDNQAVTTVITVSDEAGSHTNSLWDGTSPSRPDADVRRAPDWQDYEEARTKIRDMTTRLVPLGIAADGGMPTSDPSVLLEWYTATNILAVSAG
jgi:hypothetical protein